MLKINDIKNIIEKNSIELDIEFKRLFNGRGNLYPSWEFLTIDSIDELLSVAFYFECEQNIEDDIINMIKQYINSSRHTTVILQKRYLKNNSTEVIIGEINDNRYVVENGLKIKLNLLSNQNNGYFPDMKNGREYIRTIANNKSILNLFSYTCGFSISAISGGASSVINIDMAKSALSTGRENHHINNLSTKNVSFFPYNILKSFSRIKKKAPYDIIIIDPPTFQKGSFEATKDYNKIIKKIESLAAKKCTVLACLNSPDLDIDFIIDIFKSEASSFIFEKRLKNVSEFECIDDRRSLKNLVFKRDLL